MLVMLLSIHTGDGAAEATLVMAQCRCRVVLATVLLSHADDGAAESCWRQCYQVLLAMTLLR
jgi:hypothetical protein